MPVARSSYNPVTYSRNYDVGTFVYDMCRQIDYAFRNYQVSIIPDTGYRSNITGNTIMFELINMERYAETDALDLLTCHINAYVYAPTKGEWPMLAASNYAAELYDWLESHPLLHMSKADGSGYETCDETGEFDSSGDFYCSRGSLYPGTAQLLINDKVDDFLPDNVVAYVIPIKAVIKSDSEFTLRNPFTTTLHTFATVKITAKSAGQVLEMRTYDPSTGNWS